MHNLLPIHKKATAIVAALLLILFSYLMYRSPQLLAQELLPTPNRNNQAETASQTAVMQALLQDQQPAENLAALAATPCVGGTADGYPCSNVDLLAFMPLSVFSASSGNDIWGWTDPSNGKEYALMGLNNGTAFVDISDPVNPVYLGKLPTHSSNSSWRDIKVYEDHAFIVSEALLHGMQVFDLTHLRNVITPPGTFTEDAHYNGFSDSHNIVINEDTGYAYSVGSGNGTQPGCNRGLHMVDISTPTSPTFAGCFSDDGYTHDAQCVTYNGPDLEHVGKEVCFNSNEDTVTIVDVTNKANPIELSRNGYPGCTGTINCYTHQGWLTEDQSVFLMGDELDELNGGLPFTRTYIWDISDLENPSLLLKHDSTEPNIDHNMYVRGNLVYQSNYRAGMRILDISDAGNGNLSEIGYFDIFPANNNPNFNANWSNYPYFDSDVVIVSGIEQGLFIVRPNMPPDFRMEPTAVTLNVCSAGSDSTTFNLESLYGYNSAVTMSISGVPTGAAATFSNNTPTPDGSTELTITDSSAALDNYKLQVSATDGVITATEYLKLTISPAPTAVTNLSTTKNINNLDVDLSWPPTGADFYDVWRSSNDPYFTPGPDCSNSIDCTTITTNSYVAIGVLGDVLNNYSYLIVARNSCGATPTPSNLTGEFDFSIVAGTS